MLSSKCLKSSSFFYLARPTVQCFTRRSNSTSTPPEAPPNTPPDFYSTNLKRPQQQPQEHRFRHESSETPFTEEGRRKFARLRKYQFHLSNIPDAPEFGTNQYLTINEELQQQLKKVLTRFNAPIRYAVAYGSGVFKHTEDDGKRKRVLDFIFGVSHPAHWHALNIQQNPHHYSALRFLGANSVAMIQEKVGAGVYFNPYIEIDGMAIKYGIVSIDTLCRDLIDWDTLFLSGRMQKPVKILRDDSRVRLANQVNLTEAVRVALLTLPEQFTEDEFYKRVAGISYVGDLGIFRTATNPYKVAGMVQSQHSQFHRLYFSLLDDLPNVDVLSNGNLQQNLNPKFRGLMVQKLPKTLYKHVLDEHKRYCSSKSIALAESTTELNEQVATSPHLKEYFDRSLYSIIARPAKIQNIKGILTAGLWNSVRGSP
ncbi:mitochondrial matrix Mmp37-domain-containing protein [Phycomyces blakesleeanus]|uniref:Phosphatidate cytidylyltransferase, mitochondrial n=2 Tax=Phycomyces blakesleeanus TaxID=4837 RepID=A0A163DY39_PHYB8|nr:hypothetical protein PHYBLDRAFT_181116 [Phycomyces blakesleeanus NRRL 1555(-)]OAD74130.1 hypothetical protein PHYBLDRAFT_181116 [Phycomyces blakesleeanus NRRL 1555(-)]|eukprot:XP_018292170.1 hypothetical protein PHYBLDRAFT_181116 [Phycomyces blakesleeanus NRRL 1555(-)]